MLEHNRMMKKLIIIYIYICWLYSIFVWLFICKVSRRRSYNNAANPRRHTNISITRALAINYLTNGGLTRREIWPNANIIRATYRTAKFCEEMTNVCQIYRANIATYINET